MCLLILQIRIFVSRIFSNGLIAVAKFRLIIDVPLVRIAVGWFDRHKCIRSLLDGSTMIEILLPYAGETFDDESLAGMIGTLQKLKDVGYRIPEWVFEDLRNELQQALNDGESS